MISLTSTTVEFADHVKAIDNITFRLEPGSFTVLLGRSGSGKSTMLRLCNGLQTPTQGTVAVEGHGIVRRQADWRRHRLVTGMVFQSHQLLPRWTALANTLVGALGRRSLLSSLLPPRREDVELALDALDRVGLAHKARTRVDHLSGGERQRVGIARALVQRPVLILADEPVASLDPATAEQVLDLLRGICRQDRLTALVSLHQIDLARRTADRVVALAQGRIVFDGGPADLTESTATGIYRVRHHTEPQVLGEPALIGA